MFGWEFPPHISGGLGTACYELTRTISRHGNKITFVVPPGRKTGEEIICSTDFRRRGSAPLLLQR